jgi:hypothetical protein
MAENLALFQKNDTKVSEEVDKFLKGIKKDARRDA